MISRFIVCFLFFLSVRLVVGAQDRAEMIISRHKSVFNAVPVKTPNNVAVDGPLLGNGSGAAALGGAPDRLSFYLARNDFWRLKSGFDESFPASLASLVIHIPSLQSATYHVEQDFYNAVTTGDFLKGDTALHMVAWMAAQHDWLIIELKNTGHTMLSGSIELVSPEKGDHKFADSITKGVGPDGILWLKRGFYEDVDIKTRACVSFRVVGSTSGKISLQPGESRTIICASTSGFKGDKAVDRMMTELRKMNPEGIRAAGKKHKDWWHNFWHQSYVSINDSVVEAQYYRSQYTMASCSRDPKFPPGIFGSWITREIPAWNGDYHLNYNYIAPFYALYSSNHLQQAIPYEAPLLDFMERGKYYAARITGISDGILYPVGIGPCGIETTRKNGIMMRQHPDYISGGQVEDEGLFFGQKSNAAYCVTNLSFAFYTTYDPVFAERVYPFIRAVAEFWRQYLQLDNGRYVIKNDAIHEGTIGTVNPILSLGLVRMVFTTATDMAKFLRKDSELQGQWQYMQEKMAAYPEQIMKGRSVFRYTEEGTAWWGDNTLGIQHIYPAGQIGPDSDTAILRTAFNTVDIMKRWRDFNGSNSFFPAAVRIGYPADSIWNELRTYSNHTYPNGFQLNNPHGIENCSTVPNTVNEMLCMSNGKGLRIFGCWPQNRDAFFENIRASGAFLISSAIESNQVVFVRVKSEKGRSLNLRNPWSGKPVEVYSNKRGTRIAEGEWLNINTLAGEMLEFKPAQRSPAHL
ncbi:glycosyl hydrolase family 95 catalytic domain-containing protein [Chitinophaga flava]|uniref:Glycosyl hydrolase family 95 catalytic domain-containing protein n=1 Tax=Chitinophaga flava TaxID=2259036 RepID=A0A365XVR0_9BACT|nr:hypothetical protein [Chitinophaga flava]RBL90250.1 hypothetical protein DF182_27685 [Chitinophaga flava]